MTLESSFPKKIKEYNFSCPFISFFYLVEDRRPDISEE